LLGLAGAYKSTTPFRARYLGHLKDIHKTIIFSLSLLTSDNFNKHTHKWRVLQLKKKKKALLSLVIYAGTSETQR